MKWEEALKIAQAKTHRKATGKISCSSLPTLALCGGAAAARAQVARVEKSYSLEGSALHLCMEHNVIPDDLPPELLEKITKASNAVKYLQSQGWEILSVEPFLENDWLCGSPDMVFKRGDEFLILDFKFGWQWVDDDSSQLAGYGILVMEKYSTSEVHICVVQPDRDEARVLLIRRAIIEERLCKIRENVLLGARTPSKDACQFCPACGTHACLETQTISHELLKPELNGIISVENLRKYAGQLPLMKKALKGFEDQLRAHLESGEALDACYLKEGNERNTIESVPAAFNKIIDHVSSEDFIAKCSVTLKSVEDLLVETGVCKRKDGRAKALALLGDTVTTTRDTKRLTFR